MSDLSKWLRNECAKIDCPGNCMGICLTRDAADEIDGLRDEVKRLKSLLGRYADHVGDQEGTDFLDSAGHGSLYQITPEEAAEIASYCPSAALQETDR